jgi:flagellar hook-associated protein 3 FlgL
MAVFPVPTGRTSDLLNQTRLVAQVQSDQLRLLDLQTQVSTGRRYATPSEDPSSAIRAIGLQQLLERKDQFRDNLSTGQSYLSATDNAISGVSNLLADIRGLAVQASDSTTSATERLASAQEVQQAIQELLNVGNRQFRDRFLFAGSEAGVSPFEQVGNYVSYSGNEGQLSSFGDIGLLFGTNVPGSEIFGGLSAEVKGTADLDPVLTSRTKISDLLGGNGISKGSIAVSDGTTTSIIDFSKAETVGDLVDAIEANPPTGRKLTVRITDTGLTVDIDDAGGGNFTIREVGGGTTAAELGLRETLGVGTGQIAGDDLNPKLRLTTKLTNILGTRATGRTEDTDPNNDILLTAKQSGGFAIAYFADEAATEEVLAELKVTIRCIPLDQEVTEGRCLFTGQPTTQKAIFAKAY